MEKRSESVLCLSCAIDDRRRAVPGPALFPCLCLDYFVSRLSPVAAQRRPTIKSSFNHHPGLHFVVLLYVSPGGLEPLAHSASKSSPLLPLRH